MQVPALVMTLAQLAATLVLVVAIFVPLERLFAARRQKLLRPAVWTDLAYYVLNGLLPNLLLVVPLSVVAWAIHHAMPSGYFAAMAKLPGSVRLAGALVVGEIGFYWGHRWMHEVPALWRFHAIHHAAEHMDWLVNTRSHPFDIVFGRLCGQLPIYLIGLAQPMGNKLDMVPLLFLLIGKLWGFFVHANLKWRFGWLEWAVATPAFHHWHHANDGPAFVGKNYSAMLPWVDRLFGTHHLPRNLPDFYGIDAKLPAGLGGQLLYPLHITQQATLRQPVSVES